MSKAIIICLWILLAHDLRGDIQYWLDQGDLDAAESQIQLKLLEEDLSIEDQIIYFGLYGEVWFYRGEMSKAREFYLDAFSIAESYDLSRFIAEHAKNIAITYSEQKRYGDALQWHDRAIEALRGNFNNNVGLSVLLSQGTIYSYIGAPELAFETLSNAQNVAYEVKNEMALNNAMIRFAKLNFINGEYQLAADVLAEVNLASIQQMSNMSWYLGLSIMTGLNLKDLTYLEHMFSLYETHAPQWPDETRENFELLLLEYDVLQKELTQAQRTIDQYREQHAASESWYIEMIQAEVHKKNHRHIKALDAYRKAVELHRKQGDGLEAGQFMAVPTRLYEQTIDAALDVSYQNYDDVLSWMSELYSAKHPLFFEGKRNEVLSSTERDSEGTTEVLTDVIQAHGEKRLISVQGIRDKLGTDTAAIFYLNLNQKLIALLITPEDIYFEKIHFNFIQIEEKITQMLLQMSQDGNEWLAASKYLHDALIQPLVLHGLDQYKELWIVPDENLRLLPFDVLLNAEGHMMADQHRISVQSMNTVYKIINKKQEDKIETSPVSLSLVGRIEETLNMPQHWRTAYRNLLAEEAVYKGFEKEIQFIQSLNQSGVALLNDEATESKTKSLITKENGILHVASHGFDNPVAPAFSALLLKEDQGSDGLLQAREVAQMTTDLDMVVLASCSSAKGGFKGRYGYQLGLAEAFVSAGITAAVGTLWDVKDHKTAEFMQWFYASLQREQSVSQALYDAKQQAIKHRWNAYDWAGFTVIGDGRIRFQFKENTTQTGLIKFWLLGFGILISIGLLLFYRKSHLRGR